MGSQKTPSEAMSTLPDSLGQKPTGVPQSEFPQSRAKVRQGCEYKQLIKEVVPGGTCKGRGEVRQEEKVSNIRWVTEQFIAVGKRGSIPTRPLGRA